ncbi:MAG TPA: hypothetical protein VH500_01155 [Nitrososphaeraceae archaeon]
MLETGVIIRNSIKARTGIIAVKRDKKKLQSMALYECDIQAVLRNIVAIIIIIIETDHHWLQNPVGCFFVDF